jgi:phosphate transport system permease protein
LKAVQKLKENTLHGAFFLCAAASILVTAGIVAVLFLDTLGFFGRASLQEFFTGTEWAPKWDKFGILPLLCGTLVVSVGALLIAVPIGVGTAIYLSEFAPAAVRQIAKPVFEILAGIPSVVFGFFALTFVTPAIIQPIFPNAGTFNMLSAAIVLGVMIIPTICSLCDDAFRAVPDTLRQAAHALSATRFEVSVRIVLPAALSGVFAAVLLGLARAIGETMAVYLAAGQQPKLTLNPLSAGQTMTGYMVQTSMGDTPYGSIEYQSIFAVGLALIVITFGINFIAQRVLARFREEYD